jgi:steroid delta-isomerase-like uncharacterized protein
MGAEENKALVRRWVEEAWNNKNLSVVEETWDPNWIDHSGPPGQASGPEGARQFVTQFSAAFPDVHITIEDMVAEGDTVVYRWTGRATHEGVFQGIPPTGRRVEVPGITIHRLQNGKIAETWGLVDTLGMLQQLGVLPAENGPDA